MIKKKIFIFDEQQLKIKLFMCTVSTVDKRFSILCIKKQFSCEKPMGS
jgi:hypothetical protein